MLTIYGHRGLPSKAPENTLASFKAASEIKGLQWIELDVGITKDEQLVIIHDDFLERTTNGSGEVTQMNYEEISGFSAGAWFDEKFQEERLPTFKEIIALANEHKVNLNVELKGVSGERSYELSKVLIAKVKEQLKELDEDIEVLISSFNIPLLKMAEAEMPQFKRALIFFTNDYRSDWRSKLDFCGAKILNIQDQKLTKEKVYEIKKSGYELNVWTVNNKYRANQLFNWGVDGIFTDNADKMMHLSK